SPDVTDPEVDTSDDPNDDDDVDRETDTEDTRNDNNVITERKNKSGTGSTGGIVSGVVVTLFLVLVLIAAVVVVIICFRWKTKQMAVNTKQVNINQNYESHDMLQDGEKHLDNPVYSFGNDQKAPQPQTDKDPVEHEFANPLYSLAEVEKPQRSTIDIYADDDPEYAVPERKDTAGDGHCRHTQTFPLVPDGHVVRFNSRECDTDFDHLQSHVFCEDSGWGDEEATVVCRDQLHSHYGIGGYVHIDPMEVGLQYVNCSGSEGALEECAVAATTTMTQCSQAGIIRQCLNVSQIYVSQTEDYELFDYVEVSEGETSILDQTMVYIRVSTCFKYDMMIYSIISECIEGNVTGSTNGHLQLVEMCNSDGVWSPICDNEWTQEDATVVCRELGYRG
ncbi:hypothetical protein GBAR_LOCUS19387, partial [Geodia barretti]